ncbi:hypothetical protein EIN_210860 [Entamoeba invadens IP1]|uniref:Uncharacterized protein n=1 Tax=Entamoeba invadens IP1 TaxID=370355 RepID=L7FN77_ENTIV|nr:hypothetical protein EIN_210860 [Entamoeba invadens IP1]ELP92971.1 hypothetical protein EIN_210860 [Entamoeba invadens IP1]|eukprot:XP_004259742.1 hypothetical protein EIN_210860 [Entamoeba invadens IP1]
MVQLVICVFFFCGSLALRDFEQPATRLRGSVTHIDKHVFQLLKQLEATCSDFVIHSRNLLTGLSEHPRVFNTKFIKAVENIIIAAEQLEIEIKFGISNDKNEYVREMAKNLLDIFRKHRFEINLKDFVDSKELISRKIGRLNTDENSKRLLENSLDKTCQGPRYFLDFFEAFTQLPILSNDGSFPMLAFRCKYPYSMV